jgi:hypothetical protein
VSKAGELVVHLAVVFFGKDTLKISGLGENRGKLNRLNDKKMRETESVVKQICKGKGDVEQIWEKCRVAIAKKCQRQRSLK